MPGATCASRALNKDYGVVKWLDKPCAAGACNKALGGNWYDQCNFDLSNKEASTCCAKVDSKKVYDCFHHNKMPSYTANPQAWLNDNGALTGPNSKRLCESEKGVYSGPSVDDGTQWSERDKARCGRCHCCKEKTLAGV